MSALLDLPDDVLKVVLTYVPLTDRIGSCCLVHTRLHSAAVAATQQVHLRWRYPWKPQTVQSLQLWLSFHGQRLTRLQLGAMAQLTQLPCANLLELRLEGGSVQLGPTADGRPGVIAGTTKLTRLELICTTVSDGPGVDVSLSRLLHLRHLQWDATGQGLEGFSPATLPRLQHLTRLSGCLPPTNLVQLSALASLQELSLRSDSDREVALSPSCVSGLVLPPSLTKLELDSGDELFHADKWVELALLPIAPTGLRALRFEGYCAQHTEPPLLSLARLENLTQLVLRAAGYVDWPPPGPAYSALTASSTLLSLEVAADLRAGVWQHVFPAARQLPHLTCLVLDEDGDGYKYRYYAPALPFGPAEVACLVRCCPNLCAISCLGLTPGPHVSELRKLTALTCLDARWQDVDAGTIEGLAAVTQLQSLDVRMRPSAAIPWASLLPLTSLTALTCLHGTWWSIEYGSKDVLLHFYTEAGAAPDVWRQLLEHSTAADPVGPLIAAGSRPSNSN